MNKETITLNCFSGPKTVEAECVGDWAIHVSIGCTCGDCWVVTHKPSGIRVPAIFARKAAIKHRLLVQTLKVRDDGTMTKVQQKKGKKFLETAKPMPFGRAC